MPRRFKRTRRTTKWAAAAATTLLIAAWGASTFASAWHLRSAAGYGRDIGIESGTFIFERTQSAAPAKPPKSQWVCEWNTPWHTKRLLWPRFGWDTTTRRSQSWLYLPLWIPVALASVGTLWLFRYDRRCITPGECRRCDYPREGLEGDVPCPECGAPERRRGPRLLARI